MNKGWRQLAKEGLVDTELLTQEIILNYFKDIYKNLPKKDLTGYPKHYQWTEEEVEYSMWEIYPGVFTGDDGIESFHKAVKEEAKKYE